MNIAVSRLNKEHKVYQTEINKLDDFYKTKINLSLRGDGSNIFQWYAKISGPQDTPYESGTFLIQIDAPSDYPIKPPTCKFITKIFHPNIHLETGEICLELFKDKWAPSCNLETVCRSILDLICNPNEDSPLNCDAGNLLRNKDMIGYYYLAKMFTIDYAQEKNN